MYFQYQVDEYITLELQSPFHARELFDLINENREFIGQHLSWVNKIERLADIKHYMQRDLMGMAHERRWAWLIRYKGIAVGRIGLFITVPTLQECELYYFLGKDYTGKGIITKSAQTVVDFAINVLQLKHVLIGFSTINPKSGAVAERLGFQYEYTMRDAELHLRDWRSLHFWGILAEQWQSDRLPVWTYRLGDEINLSLYQPYQSEQKVQSIKANLAEFGQWFWWANDRITLAKEKAIARRILKRYAVKSGIGVSIWKDKQFLGYASLSVDSQNKSGSLSYWLDHSARGKGIMTQSLQVLIEDAFESYRLQCVRILIAEENIKSRAVAERLGMQVELIQKDETRIRGQFVDHVLYSLLREEWKEQNV